MSPLLLKKQWLSTLRNMQQSLTAPAAQPARLQLFKPIHYNCFLTSVRLERNRRPNVRLSRTVIVDAAADADQAISNQKLALEPDQHDQSPNQNSSIPSVGTGDEAAQSGRVQSSLPSSWDATSTVDEADWVGQKPFSWKEVDWGLASLVGVILLLSFGAYRVLNYFSVFQHGRRPPNAHPTTMQQPAASSSTPSTSSSTSNPTAAATPSSSNKFKPNRSRRNKQSKQQAEAVADTGGAAAEVVAVAGMGSVTTAGAGPSGYNLPAASGIPGAPQPNPLDAEFNNSMAHRPWPAAGSSQLELSKLSPLPDPSAPLQPPELPSIQVEPPAKAVTQLELAALPSDPSLPSLRERAHIAMRASGAAMEASQRAAAYSAAASSAASRAADAAEQAAAAAAAVQAALEQSANEAMSAAVKRMNRAVEMVADAESRAAAAAAMATAYQDISDSQAAAAAAAADLPAMPAAGGAVGHIANLKQVLHEQMFSVKTVLGDFAAGIWAAVVGAVAAVRAVLAALWMKLLGLFGFNGGTPGGTSGASAGVSQAAAGSSS